MRHFLIAAALLLAVLVAAGVFSIDGTWMATLFVAAVLANVAALLGTPRDRTA